MNRLDLLNNQIVKPNKAVWVMKNIPGFDFEKAGNLKGKTLVITGASRGIGLEIALTAARDGANIAILAKTTDQTVNHKHKKRHGALISLVGSSPAHRICGTSGSSSRYPTRANHQVWQQF